MRRMQPRPSLGAVPAILSVLCALAFAATLSGCGASTALGNAVLAPISVLSDTDVALETNLQSAVQGGQSTGGISGISAASEIASSGGNGVPEVSGPPTSPSEVSVATAAGVSVYTAFNPVDRHCLGTFELASGSVATVLAETTPGSYDFWFGPTTATACNSAVFTSETTVPSGWANGDPSSTGWPGV